MLISPIRFQKLETKAETQHWDGCRELQTQATARTCLITCSGLIETRKTIDFKTVLRTASLPAIPWVSTGSDMQRLLGANPVS